MDPLDPWILRSLGSLGSLDPWLPWIPWILGFCESVLCGDFYVALQEHRPIDELSVFNDLRPEISLGLGVIDVKINKVETPDAIAKKIEVGSKILGKYRIKYINPDCGFWMLNRSVVDKKRE